MKARHVFVLMAAVAGLLLNAHADIPLMINHQGLVKVNGLPFTGNGAFKFGFVDAGGFWLWTNDGSFVGQSAGTNPPATAVPLPVTNGIYNVRLGDLVAHPSMVPIPSGVFDDDDVKLRVLFNDGVNGQQLLTPDQPVTAGAYAYHAAEADHAGDSDLLEGLTAAEVGIPAGNAIIGLSLPPPPGYSDSGVTVGGAWSAGANMPAAKGGFATASVNDVVYAIGGPSLSTNYAYVASTNTWSTKASLPATRGYARAAAVNGIVYVIGGSASSVNEAYDPVNNTWATKAPMPTAREFPGVAVVDGIIHVIGGYNAGSLATHEAYNPATNTWTTKASMTPARGFCGAAVVNGIIYVIGGYTPPASALNQAYDPVTNTWSTKAPMPAARYGHAVVAAGGVVYAIGGTTDSASSVNSVYSYNPANDTWTTGPIMPTARYFMGAAVINGRNICVVGGGTTFENVTVATTEILSPHVFVFVKD